MNPPADSPPPARLTRREVLTWFAAAMAAGSLPQLPLGAAPSLSPARGYGTDPKLAEFYAPGAFWPLTFTAAQRAAATAFADVLLPADHLGPAASTLRVPDYLDEWISAPYPIQQADREIILPGLQWLDDESRRRFGSPFSTLPPAAQHEICDAICGDREVPPPLRKAAGFFRRFRTLAASAYYGTEAGWKALGYVGNVALATFEGPPPEVLARLGVEQTVR